MISVGPTPGVANNHNETPLISLDENVDNSNVYVLQHPTSGDQVYVVAEASGPNSSDKTHKIVYNLFNDELGAEHAAFAQPIEVTRDAESGLNARFPTIAANRDGVVAVVHQNDTDFSVGPPFATSANQGVRNSADELCVCHACSMTTPKDREESDLPISR